MDIQMPDIQKIINKNFIEPINWYNKYGNFYVIEYVGADAMFRGEPTKSTISAILNASSYIAKFPKNTNDIFNYLKSAPAHKDMAEIALEIQKNNNVLGGTSKNKANFLVYDKDYTVDKRANVCKEWKECASYTRLGLAIEGISKEKKVMKRNDMIVCLVRSWVEGKWN